VAVCGTAGPGVVHLFNGLMDARKEGAAIIAIAGDVETGLIDTAAVEELNPYKFFEAASLYTGRVVNPEQARPIFNTAILTALLEKGPTVISLPGDIASADAPAEAAHSTEITIPATPVLRPSDADLNQLVEMIDDAKRENGSDLRRRRLQRCPRGGAPSSRQIKGSGRLTAEPIAQLMRLNSCCCSARIFPSQNSSRTIVSRKSRSIRTPNTLGAALRWILGLSATSNRRSSPC
jgi:hypothetical protein